MKPYESLILKSNIILTIKVKGTSKKIYNFFIKIAASLESIFNKLTIVDVGRLYLVYLLI